MEIDITVSRTKQVSSFEPLTISMTVRGIKLEDSSEIQEKFSRHVDECIGLIEDKLALHETADKSNIEGEIEFNEED